MDKTTLVKDDIIEGRKLIEHLDKTDFKVNSALWFYVSDSNKWKLVLSSEYSKNHSLKDAYNFIQKELTEINPVNLELGNISIVNADDDLIKLLRHMITTGDKDISDIRFSRNVINGVMIEDALIYRISSK
jgi:hypothetical protein